MDCKIFESIVGMYQKNIWAVILKFKYVKVKSGTYNHHNEYYSWT